jgi:hypothetical protein
VIHSTLRNIGSGGFGHQERASRKQSSPSKSKLPQQNADEEAPEAEPTPAEPAPELGEQPIA